MDAGNRSPWHRLNEECPHAIIYLLPGSVGQRYNDVVCLQCNGRMIADGSKGISLGDYAETPSAMTMRDYSTGMPWPDATNGEPIAFRIFINPDLLLD